MISHLFKLIVNQWRSNIWLMAELFISFVCIWMISDAFVLLLDRSFKERGFDIEHTYMVSNSRKSKESPDYDPNSGQQDEARELAERIRHYPGVEVVGFGTAFPYRTGYSAFQFYRDTLSMNGVYYGYMTPEFFSVFNYKPVDENIYLEEEVKNGHWLASRTVMEKLLGKGVLKGRLHYGMKDIYDMEGVCVMTTANFARCEYLEEPDFVWITLSEKQYLNSYGDEWNMFFRVAPQADHDFRDKFLASMRPRLIAGNSMITDIVPMETHRNQVLRLLGFDMYYSIVYFLAAFFLLCTFLGVIGTFWFRTEARTSEIGLRMALGSTRKKVRQLMIGEGLALFGLIWIPGMVIAYLLRGVVNIFDYTLPLPDGLYFLFISIFATLLMSLLIIAGTWYPARQASRINPVDALHYE